jgi:hypothetical protein
MRARTVQGDDQADGGERGDVAGYLEDGVGHGHDSQAQRRPAPANGQRQRLGHGQH